MAILGAWTSLADCETSIGAIVYTGAGGKGPYVSEGINLGATDSGIFVQIPTPAVSDFWLSWYWYLSSISSANQPLLRLLAADNTPLFQLVVNGSTTTQLDCQVWTGSAWSTMGSFIFGAYRQNLTRMELRLKIADAGTFELYANGLRVVQFSGDTLRTAETTISKMRFQVSYSNTNSEYLSAILMTDANEPPFDLHMTQNLPTGNGGQTAWVGDYTAVDETGFSSLDFVSSDTVGQVETFTYAALNSALNGMDVYAVVNSAMSRVGASGPGNITGVVRTASTDYDASDYSPPIGQLTPKQIIMSTNPATSAQWTVSEVNSHEIGFKAKA